METLAVLPATAAAVANASFVDTAAAIGRLICRDAIWHGPRCTLLTATSDPAYPYPKPYVKSLDADFYAGSAGVGFFLAALQHATPDRLILKTALGIWHNTLQTVRRIPPGLALSFFSGWVGVACAAIRSGQWLGSEALTEAGWQLLDEAVSDPESQQGIDVIDGIAGALPVLIYLNRERPSPAVSALIEQSADQLVASAVRHPAGWSWETVPGATHRDLTGFAHGTAGIANALFEAFAYTQNPAYREAGFEGFRYENAFFDQQQQNWPDFRATEQPHDYSGPVCSCAWCHGAPGIALSRLRGYELTRHPGLRQEALTAVQTTSRLSTWALQPNFSQCHGLAGNADVLLEAADVLNEESYRQQAEAIGQLGQQLWQDTGLWANGLQNGYQLPDFMLGLSGTGYFYLRLADSVAYRSVLALR